MERKYIPEIQPGTAPKGCLDRGVRLDWQPPGRIFAGMGAFDSFSRIRDASFEKRSPCPNTKYFDYQNG